MSNAALIARAAAPWADVIRDLKPDQLDATTPCAEYDVRALVNHLFYWVRRWTAPAARSSRHRRPHPRPRRTSSATTGPPT
jgi:hypothetical protein